MSYWIAFIPIILSLGHWFGLHRHPKLGQYINQIQSFAAGFSIAYVFLLLLPELHSFQEEIQVNTYVLTLLGFVLFHAALKLIFSGQRESRERTLLSDQIHLLTSAIYSFLVTFLLVELSRFDGKRGAVLASVIIIHTVLMELTTLPHHRNSLEKFKVPVAIFATILGGLLAMADVLSRYGSIVLFGITAGGILYITVREEIPTESKGKPIFFLTGVLSLLFVVTVIL